MAPVACSLPPYFHLELLLRIMAYVRTLLWMVLPLLSSSLLAQDEVPWLSLSRLTVSSAATYHYRPWNFYNNSLSLVEQAVRYDFVYTNPSGSFEKILGDAGGEISASYRILSGLSLEVFGSYGETGGAVHLTYGPPSLTIVIEQEISLRLYEFGSGIRYIFKPLENVSLAAVVRISKAYGTMDYEFLFLPPWQWKHLYQAELKDRTTVSRIGLEATYPLWNNVKLIGSVEYRWMSFDKLEGAGKETNYYGSGPDYENSFRARLAQINGYFFGVEAIEGTHIYTEHLMHTLWSRTELYAQWWSNREPAILDLSSLGLKLGVSYEF